MGPALNPFMNGLRFPDAKESDEWGVVPDAGYEVKPSPQERQQYVEYRVERDVFRPEGPRKSDYKDMALQKAIEYVAAAAAKARDALRR